MQRALAAKNLLHAKAGCIFAGYLKLLPMFIIIMPGMISRILFNGNGLYLLFLFNNSNLTAKCVPFVEEIGCSDPVKCMEICGNENGCSNIAYPKLIIDVMPDGLRGLMVAVMIAALMSSLTSVFNSCSVIFTMDIWKRFRSSANEIELMIVGRVFVVVFVVMSIFWIPVIEMNQGAYLQNLNTYYQNYLFIELIIFLLLLLLLSGSRLFDYVQSVTSFLAPPVCAVYVQAILFKRINEPGAFWGLVSGLLTGICRFAWQFAYDEPPCAKSYTDKRPWLIAKVHFLHIGIVLFVITLAVSWIVSLLTPPIPEEQVKTGSCVSKCFTWYIYVM